MQKIFNPIAIDVRMISLTDEKLHFNHHSVRGVIYAVIDVLCHLSVILQPCNFCKFFFPIFLVLLRQLEKSQKYFDRLAFN